MAPVLHIFNPENDIALSRNCGSFTPPAAARAIACAGAYLPLFYAPSHDLILPNRFGLSPLLGGVNHFISSLRNRCGHQLPALCLHAQCVELGGVSPWGWSRAIRADLQAAGVNICALPSLQQLTHIRDLSHRRLSVNFAQEMSQRLSYHVDIAIEAQDMETALNAVKAYGRAMVKLPYSCSGRGVFDSASLSPTALRQVISSCLHSQGSVMVEKHHERVLDFALICHYRPGHPRFLALSMFDTEGPGNYSRNYLMDDKAIRERICHLVDPEIYDQTVKSVLMSLNNILGNRYEGILGIDMLVAKDGDKSLYINPCVEINLRKTMGYVAAMIYRNIVHPLSRGYLGLERDGASDIISPIEDTQLWTDGYLSSGKLYLTPGPAGCPRFFIKVEPAI